MHLFLLVPALRVQLGLRAAEVQMRMNVCVKTKFQESSVWAGGKYLFSFTKKVLVRCRCLRASPWSSTVTWTKEISYGLARDSQELCWIEGVFISMPTEKVSKEGICLQDFQEQLECDPVKNIACTQLSESWDSKSKPDPFDLNQSSTEMHPTDDAVWLYWIVNTLNLRKFSDLLKKTFIWKTERNKVYSERGHCL